MGVITTPPQYRKALECIDIARAEGARAVLGGAKGDAPERGSGWFVQPTVFTGVRADIRIAQEEVFGPVLSVIRFKDEADALRIANDVRFGLAAAVWTKDIGRAVSGRWSVRPSAPAMRPTAPVRGSVRWRDPSRR